MIAPGAPNLTAANPRPQAKSRMEGDWILDGVLCLGLLALGAALRWPQLWNIPVFTDEWDEIAVSLDIIRIGARPLTNADPYYGALTSYLMAGFFLVSGVSMEAPRAFALLMGVLQIGPAYYLTLELGRAAGQDERRARLTAVLSGLLLCSSSAHIVLNSHLAWANSTTPLFTTLAMWLIVRARRRYHEDRTGGIDLTLAGLCLGLALQTHILVLVLIVGLGLAALLTLPRLALSRWGVLALGGMGLGYANMLVFNIGTAGETLRHAQSMSAGYAGGKDIPYLEKLESLLMSLLRVLGGAIDRREAMWSYLADPILIAGLVGSLFGVGYFASRRQSTPLLALLSMVCLLPLVNNRYEPLFSGRYLSPLLPPLFAGLSLTLVMIAGWRRLRFRETLIASGLVSIFCVYSLFQLQGLYGRLESSGRSNTRVLELVREMQANGRPGELVYLDNRLNRRRLMEAGAGDMERVFSALLDVTNTPFQVVTIDDSWVPGHPGLVILASRDNPRTTVAIIDRLQLTLPDGGAPPPMDDGAIFGLYRAAEPRAR
ncbi:MAG: phospholipid carrier-dependent glycosyltransferase [Chloroflexota bacterium]